MPGLSFEDVLDEALAAQGDDGVTGGARFWTGPPPTFFFPFWSRAPQTEALTSAFTKPSIPRRHGFGGQAECPPSPRLRATGRLPSAECRVLTARQQEALDHLVSLGAPLRADFTARELRSAFRQLARRYHPDRHHGGPAAEIAHATRVFATMSGHYQCLLAAIDERA